MTVAAAAKAALLGASGALAPLLPDVIVSCSEPRGTIPREMVYGGTVTGPVSLAGMAGGGRVSRNETLILPLHVRIWHPGGEPEAVDARAAEIAVVIGNYIAANWTLGALDGLKKATVDGLELESWHDDDGAGCLLTLAVGLTSHLT